MKNKYCNKLNTILMTAGFVLLIFLLLGYSSQCLGFALTGLNLWFQKMVPTLLPFMILSGMMVRMELTGKFVSLLRPLFQPLYRIGSNALYAIIIGFLCGFPMGARVVADLYSRRKITRKEATFLLAFCNNIGPIYFTGFVLPTLALKKTVPYLIGMYGLPLLYGLVLRFTVYRKELSLDRQEAFERSRSSAPVKLLDALDESIITGLDGITKLGGYMIFFNLLNIIPLVLLKQNNWSGIFNCLLEITSGIQAMGSGAPLIVLVILPFGGFSCLAQTYSMIHHTDLSLKTYIIHKLILTFLSLFYYAFLQTVIFQGMLL